MSSNQKKADVSTRSSAYLRMEPRWAKLEALLGGTEAMRAAGRKYLPQHEGESNERYAERLGTATLFNFTELTLNSLAGKPFDEDISLAEDASEDFRAWSEDVDQQGTNLTRFCETWFKDGLAKGLSHVLVDFPHLSREIQMEDGTTRPRTLEDDRRENVRPYWLHIPPEKLIFASAVIENGQEVLEHVRFEETVVERDGFAEVSTTRVRVLERGYFEVWEKRDKEWIVVESGSTGLPIVPLVTFYAAKRTGLMEVKPPLLDLADLNVLHWQGSSDQNSCLTVARFPILAVSGADADELGKLRIGPHQWLSTPDAQGKWYFVEHQGAALKSGAEDLEKLEDRMASYGAEFLKRRNSQETAASRILDESGALSPLTAMARNFKDNVELALVYTAQWMGLAIEDSPSVTMKTEFSEEQFAETEIKDLLALRTARELSREAFIEELKRRRFLREDYDQEADKELIDEEGPDDSDLGGMFNNGLPDDQDDDTNEPPTE